MSPFRNHVIVRGQVIVKYYLLAKHSAVTSRNNAVLEESVSLCDPTVINAMIWKTQTHLTKGGMAISTLCCLREPTCMCAHSPRTTAQDKHITNRNISCELRFATECVVFAHQVKSQKP